MATPEVQAAATVFCLERYPQGPGMLIPAWGVTVTRGRAGSPSMYLVQTGLRGCLPSYKYH